MCEYVNTRLGQIEWEIELGLSNLYAQNFDHTLKVLLTWRRRMPIYHVFVERAISRLSARYKSEHSTTPFNSWEDILTNLREILHRIEVLHSRADKIMVVSMAVTAREESKKATQKSHAITRVTYLAFIFAPLSFWATFFSMSGDFPIGTYRIYTAISLPITTCMLGVLLFAGRFGRWWERMREDKGLRREKGKLKWASEV
jgi:Mg2+ and Co2+ transporter CorA